MQGVEGTETAPAGVKALTLEQEFLALTRKNLSRNPIGVLLSQCLIAGFAFDDVSPYLALGWLLLAITALLGRAQYIKHLLSRAHLNEKLAVRKIYQLNALNGLLAAISLCFFPFLSDIERILQTSIILSWGVGVVATNAGLRYAYLPYLLMSYLALSLAWILFPFDGDALWKSYAMAALMTFLIFVLMNVGRDTYVLFKTAVDMRQRYAQINQQLTQALADAKSSSAAKTRFLAAASHDLRQPVHALSLLSAALQGRALEGRVNDISRLIAEALATLSRQLNALLDISKIDAGVTQPNPQTVNLTASLQAIIDHHRPLAESKGLQLSFDCEPDVMVYSDLSMLESICMNLVGNAVKYTEIGRVCIRLATEADTVTLLISDTGPGIAEENTELIYEEFYQVGNRHRASSEGLGLGLSIVKRLTALLNITMRMSSELGRGTQFQLRLPVAQPSSARPADATDKNQRLPAGKQLLIVDDEVSNLEAARHYFESIGWSVDVADGAEQARVLASITEPDLVISDFRLKDDVSGLQVIQALRERYPGKPAILVTGDTAPDRLREAAAADAELLHKPIDLDALRRVLLKVS